MEEADLQDALFEEMTSNHDSDSSEGKDEIIPSKDDEPEVPLVQTLNCRRNRGPKPTDNIK